MVDAFLRSRFSNSESTRMFGPFEASQSSLMLGFLLDCKRCRLVKLILAALCANVGIPSPQKPVGELAHSVTQELGGELKPFSNMTGAQSVYHPRHKGVSKLVYFQFKIKLRWHIHIEYFEFCLTPDPKRGNYSKNLI